MAISALLNKRSFRTIFSTRNDLLNQFKVFKKANTLYGFTQYKSDNWAPNDIENNKASLKSLLLRLDTLLVIGINLKNVLLDSDDQLQRFTYAPIRADHTVIRKFKK
jgi:hypothetical protein